MSPTSNPQFSRQWHFDLIGDLEAVWRDYTGAGVRVGIYDDGTERTHRDLAPNYQAALHYSGLGFNNGQPVNGAASHGTAVAGIIAAADNGTGGVGVAYGAGITGVDLLNGVFDQGGAVVLDALRYMGAFDITNNSWGFTPDYAGFLNLGNLSSQSSREAAAILSAVTSGRDGLGTIVVKAAGNDANSPFSETTYGLYGNAQGAGLNSLHTLVTVGATGRSGDVASYSNWGANLLIAAPAASVTTDLAGSRGYSYTDYTTSFGGTSAATPVISGVVALMLDANPGLGWRDVQNILALSARHTGSDYGSDPDRYEQGRWFSNGAENWNGGGMSYHLSYGFGMVDAYAAVRMAEVWELLQDSPATSANDRMMNTTRFVPQSWDNGTRNIILQVANDMQLEHLYVDLTGSHSTIGDLSVVLQAPTGERYDLFTREMKDEDLPGSWIFGVAGVLGVSAQGRWQVEIRDHSPGNPMTLSSVRLEMHGAAPQANTIHHVTEDFELYAARDPQRRTLSDSDGGRDWLNLASLRDDVTLSLATGGALEVGGRLWATHAGGIEQAVSGDGNDRLRAGTVDTLLVAGRGNDHVSGGRGADSLLGGAGRDTLLGAAGTDRLQAGEGNDLMAGGTGDDSLLGEAGRDTLYGNDGQDTVNGAEGDDVLSGGNGDDLILGRAGQDSLRGGNGNDRFYGGQDDDVLLGQRGDDDLEGGSGNDTLNGDIGNDNGLGGPGDDLVLGRAGADTLRGGDGNDRFYGGQDDDALAGNAGNDTLAGGSDNDRLFGGSGADRLVGGPGADTLAGGPGPDTFVFDTDPLSGPDSVTDFTIGEDLLDLSGIVPAGRLVAEFSGTAGELRYDGASGQLFADLAGDGQGALVAVLSGAPALSGADFVL